MSDEERMDNRQSLKSRCIVWPGNKTPKGYGRIYTSRNEFVMAHRAVYEGCFGKIPDGMIIDHLCRNTSCVNPRHMEAVTSKENVLRGIGLTAINKRKTSCKRGHPLSGKNLATTPKGARYCRICKRASVNLSRAAIRTRKEGGA